MIQTYQEAVNFLYANLPMFQRVGAVAYRKDLTNTLRLSAALGDPHLKFRSVHIGGTNGKGSSSHMLASVLQQAGYRTGLYTSPHLKSFTERIRVNGEEIDRGFVVDFVNRVRPLISKVEPSFFEITVVMAFEYFLFKKVDVAVVEVGLGGRLDSTNIITPIVSLITNIGWDHKDILGDTLEKIASEKAGIIKSHRPAVISERQPDLEHVFRQRAKEVGAPIHFASDTIQVSFDLLGKFIVTTGGRPLIDRVDLPLKGFYQKKNLPGVLRTIEVLNTEGFKISQDAIVGGLENVVTNTHLKGRWQKLSDRPLVICDTGHNIDGVTEVVRQLGSVPHKHLRMVVGMVKDKDVSAILEMLPKQASYYFCQAGIPRAMDAEELAQKASAVGLHGMVIRDVNEAKRKALSDAGPDDLIFIGGSTFVVAELDEL